MSAKKAVQVAVRFVKTLMVAMTVRVTRGTLLVGLTQKNVILVSNRNISNCT